MSAPRLWRRSRATGPGDRSADERHGLVDDAWAATLAGSLEATAFLDLVLRGFTAERDLTVWQALTGALAHLRQLLDGDAARHFCELAVGVSDAAAAEVGLDPPGGGENARTSELRAVLVQFRGATADHAATVDACRWRLDHSDATLAAAALGVVAAHGDGDDFARIRRRFEEASDPQTEQRHLAALADFGEAELVRTILEGTLDGSVRSQDGPYLIRRALANRRCGPVAWDFLTEHWGPAPRRLPGQLSRPDAGRSGLAGPPRAGRGGARLHGRAPLAPRRQAGGPAPGAPRSERRPENPRVPPPVRRRARRQHGCDETAPQ